LERSIITYIHPVHAALQYVDLTHDSVSMQRFLELLEGIEVDDRYAIVDCIASLVGLKPIRQPDELDLQLRRCRKFKEACIQLEGDESNSIRAFIEHIFDYLFLSVWKITAKELSERSEPGICELSCKMEEFERNNWELWRSNDRDSYFRIQSFRRYMLFGEQVAGPLIGYC